MLTISLIILLAVSAFVPVDGYKKSTMGTLCENELLEIKTEAECRGACTALGYPYLSSWDGPGDFPRCTFTEGYNQVCHFNTNANPGRTNVNSRYAAICKECVDTQTAQRCTNQGINNNRCANPNWQYRENCLATCGLCTATATSTTYEKSAKGTLCENEFLEIKTEAECKTACASLGYQYLSPWDGPGDFPRCTFTEGYNKVCHFNTNANPDRASPNPQYAAICKDCADTETAQRCNNQGIVNGRCANANWAKREQCLATCALCDPTANVANYAKSAMGTVCNPQTKELATEAECRTACAELGITYLSAWNGPGDFPACVYTEGLNKVCHFNTSPNPDRTNIRAEYAAICTA